MRNFLLLLPPILGSFLYNCNAEKKVWQTLPKSELSARVVNTVWMWTNADWEERENEAAKQQPVKKMEAKVAAAAKLPVIKLDLPSISGDLEMNQHAIEALKEALGNRKNFDYAPSAGLMTARQAIIKRFSHDHPLHDVPLSVRDVFVTGGASTSLEFAFQAIANPGHNILLPMPGWQYYRTLCQANNISCRRYRIKFHPEANAQIDLKNLEEKIDANTRAILVNNPTNPHGAVLPREQLEALLAIAEKHKLPIISDETFTEMVFAHSNAHFHSLVDLLPRVPLIICDGVGKRYLLPGWRLGWIIVHDRHQVLTQVRDGIAALMHLIKGPSTLIQATLPRILEQTDKQFFAHTNAILERNAKFLFEKFRAIPGFQPFMPQSGWFMTVQMDNKMFTIDASAFVQKLRNEMNLFVVDGSIFGVANGFRIALVVDRQTLEEAIKRIEMLSAKHMKVSVVKQTEEGPVQGFLALDGNVDVFLGIPYARAPVGDQLRLEKPEPAQHRDEVWQAWEHAKSCYIHATPDWLTELLYDQKDSADQSEDCLYLNIFSPNKANSYSKLPVLFIIHGGGFEMGTSQQYAHYRDIGATFVQHGIVVVSIQYRLGLLGFGSTGDNTMPGNLGLWDQLMALKWVRRNIANFGGDPEQITLFGHSAGAGSVSAHSLAPESRDLFARAIQMSGSAYSNWAYGSRVADETLRLADALGCRGKSAEIKSCLKQIDPVEMQRKQIEIGPTRKDPNPGFYQIRYDGDFFPEPLTKLALTAPKKPTLISFTKLESSVFTIVTNPPNGSNSTLFETGLKWDELNSFGEDQLRQFINDHVAYTDRFGEEAEPVTTKITEFLANSNAEAKAKDKNTFWVHQYVQLCSDLLFAMPPLMEAGQKARLQWPIYMYQFNYANEAAFPEPIKIHEAYHAYDLDYVFDNPNIPYKFNDKDREIQAFMQQTMRNFIKKGNPSTSLQIQTQHPNTSLLTSKGVHQQKSPTSATTSVSSAPMAVPRWPIVDKDQPNFAHVEVLAQGPVVRSEMPEEQAHLAFWKRLSAEHPQFDLLYEAPRADWMHLDLEEYDEHGMKMQSSPLSLRSSASKRGH